jgi:hypothetical protein
VGGKRTDLCERVETTFTGFKRFVGTYRLAVATSKSHAATAKIKAYILTVEFTKLTKGICHAQEHETPDRMRESVEAARVLMA